MFTDRPAPLIDIADSACDRNISIRFHAERSSGKEAGARGARGTEIERRAPYAYRAIQDLNNDP